MILENLKVKPIPMEAGKIIVILHEEDLKEIGGYLNDRVKITTPKTTLVAIADTTRTMVQPGEIGTCIEAAKALDVKEGDTVSISPAPYPQSRSAIKKKMRGERLSEKEVYAIVDDIVAGNLTTTELTAFVTTQYIREMTMDEIVALTRRMVESGERIDFEMSPVLDVHSIGGVPGNKYALITVPIVAAAGLPVPKTSSRAITSAAGTADVMEILTNVELNAEEIKSVVKKVGATLAWGGALKLAPADDILINVERVLNIDPRCQLLASVMSKKIASGADHILIDIPVGPGAKVEVMEEGRGLAHDFLELGHHLHVQVETALTYGGQPVGYAVGPALEAQEALETLAGKGPGSLVEKAVSLAGIMLEFGGVAAYGTGRQMALDILNSGKADKKFRQIIEAQGGDPKVKPEDLPIGSKKEEVNALHDGYITNIDNHRIINIARAAGAPRDKGAGVKILLKKGHKVNKDEPLFEIYAEHETKLGDAVALAKRYPPIKLESMLLEKLTHTPHVG